MTRRAGGPPAGLLAAPAVAADLPTLTQDNGAPVGDNQHSKTAGPEGGVLLEDFHLIEKLARFDRERIPERVVHARGTLGLARQQGNLEMVALLGGETRCIASTGGILSFQSSSARVKQRAR